MQKWRALEDGSNQMPAAKYFQLLSVYNVAQFIINLSILDDDTIWNQLWFMSSIFVHYSSDNNLAFVMMIRFPKYLHPSK